MRKIFSMVLIFCIGTYSFANSDTPQKWSAKKSTANMLFNYGSYKLVDADTGQEVSTLTASATNVLFGLDQLTDQKLFSIEALVPSSDVSVIKKVVFSTDDGAANWTEGTAPYVYKGDITSGGVTDYFGYTPSLGFVTFTVKYYNVSSISSSTQPLYTDTFTINFVSVTPDNTGTASVWTKTGSNIYYNGDVGIGTDVTDGYKLAVDGSLHVKGFTLKHGGSDFVLGTNAYRSIGEKVNQRALVHDNNDVLKVNYEGDFEGGVVINGPRTMITGVVGIGNAPVPTGYKLAVNGKIIGEEVLVKLKDNWPDYVFDKAYNLPTLDEVQKHINEKGHLINIPSAAEVEANGIELGEMNKLLLEKIEELTLYILEQEENQKLLEQRIKIIENNTKK